MRYALIGPNGAGKTTLINLMTGMLRPDAGAILLDDADITALAPDQRVRRGLVRTYQINSLFPHLTALESVTLAVCERSRAAQHLVAAASRLQPRDRRGLRHSLGADARRGLHRATRELAYGQQRLLEIALALATRPKVLLLDEPAAGVPREESKELFAAIAGLSRDITVLFIEHDMELVFRFASRVIVMVGGRVLVEGSAAGNRLRPAGARGLSRQSASTTTPASVRAMTEPLLSLDDVRAGYGPAVVLDGVSFDAAGTRQPRRARPERRRQVDAPAHHHGLHASRPRPRPLARRGHHPRARRIAARLPASAGWRRSARFFPR